MTRGPDRRAARPPTPAPPAEESASAADDPRLTQAVEEYRTALEAGRRPDRQALFSRYPDLVQDLAGCLDAVDFVHAAARQLGRTGADGPPGPTDMRPGEPLGDFRLLREVGRGGMGVVYEAEQVSLRRRVALKVLPFAAVLDPRRLQRFRHEAQAAASLHHPNIVPVYAVGCERAVHFYAMQLIEGQTLAALIRDQRRAAGLPAGGHDRMGGSVTEPWRVARRPAAGETKRTLGTERSLQAPAFFRTVARLGVQAAEALEHAHQQGVVHRDIKPANLLVDASGNVWVTDFGLAQLHGDPGLTATGDVVGTLRYMSPEQALAQRGFVDHRTDIYSLGVTLYELLTLEPAFPGEDRQDLLTRIVLEEPRPLHRLNRAIPAELETVIGKAMAKGPEDRYATAGELADDLRRFLDDRPVLARRPGLLVRLRKWARRRRAWVVSIAVSVVLLLAALACGATVYGLQRDQDLQQSDKRRREVEQQLHKALLGRAAGFRLARQPGYRAKAWKDLHEAAGLDIPDKDFGTIRAEVLAALGDPVGLDPKPAGEIARRPPPPKVFGKFPIGKYTSFEISAVSPDGNYLAAGGYSIGDGAKKRAVNPQAVVVIDEEENPHWFAFSPLDAINALTFTPNGYLVAGCDKGVVVWALIPGMPAMHLRLFFWAGNIHSIDVHPSGRLLATGGRQVELWSLATNRLVASFQPRRQGAQVEFSADGKWLLEVAGEKVLGGWPVMDTPEKKGLEGHRDGVPSVAFSTDGRRLVSGSKDGTVRIWDASSGKLLQSCREHHSTPIEAVTFSPDGRWLASGDVAGTVILRDVLTGAEAARVESWSPALKGMHPPGQIWRLQFDATGKHLAGAGVESIAVWSIQPSGSGVALHPHLHANPPYGGLQVHDLAIHPADGDLVFLDGRGRLFRQEAAVEGKALELTKLSGWGLRCLHFDGAGRRLTFRSKKGTLGLWDWSKREAHVTDLPAFHLAFHAGGRWVAASNPAQGVVVYDVQERRQMLTLPPEPSDAWSLAWSPDGGRLAVGLADGGLVIWDLEQVRARLAEFGIRVPATTSPR
jgi:serine/threonine protein kinase/WD40 repeat protein